MNARRAVIIGAILTTVIVVSLLGYAQFGQRAPTSAQVELTTVKRGTIQSTVTAAGNLAPAAKVSLTFKSGGKVAAIDVAEGEVVQKGRTLMRLDTTDLEFAVAQAQAGLTSAQASLHQLQNPRASEVATAEAQVASAKAAYDKVRAGPSQDDLMAAQADVLAAEATLAQAQAAYDLVASRPNVAMLSQSLQLQSATIDYQRAVANYNKLLNPAETDLKSTAATLAQAQATLDKLKPTKEDLDTAQAKVDQAQMTLDQAKLNLADASLFAPFDGVVASIAPKVGENVSAASAVIVFVDASGFYTDLSIDETEIGKVDTEQAAEVTLDAFPGETLKGRVTYVAPTATISQGVVTYKARVNLDQSPLPIKEGMTANVNIIVARREGVLVVPNRAIQTNRQTGKSYVEKWVAGQAVRTEVQIGLQDDLNSEVIKGLSEGDRVVLQAAARSSSSSPQPFMGGPPP